MLTSPRIVRQVRKAGLEEHVRYYEIAGITVQVESDLPITDATFDRKFEKFRVHGPGEDTVVIRHHFGPPGTLPGWEGPGSGEEVYRKAPWGIYRVGESWVYEDVTGERGDSPPHLVAIFNADHTFGDIHSCAGYEAAWTRGGLRSLTMFPTDQIVLARLVADRQSCLLHSAGLAVNDQGLVFVGHSDAGKSTTVGLILGQLGDRAEVLCDDRIVIRYWPRGFRGGVPGFYAHGTWSHGDVADVSGVGVPLRAVLFLEQREVNEIMLLSDRKQVWRRLLATLIRPMVTDDWWQKEMDVLGRIVTDVECFAMRFDRTGAIVGALERLTE